MLFLTDLFFYYKIQFYMNFCHLQIETKDFILHRMVVGFFNLKLFIYLFIYLFRWLPRPTKEVVASGILQYREEKH